MNPANTPTPNCQEGWTMPQLRRVATALARGREPEDVAREVGRSVCAMHSALRRGGWSWRQLLQHGRAARLERAAERVEGGEPPERVAREWGISELALQRRAERVGIHWPSVLERHRDNRAGQLSLFEAA